MNDSTAVFFTRLEACSSHLIRFVSGNVETRISFSGPVNGFSDHSLSPFMMVNKPPQTATGTDLSAECEMEGSITRIMQVGGGSASPQQHRILYGLEDC